MASRASPTPAFDVMDLTSVVSAPLENLPMPHSGRILDIPGLTQGGNFERYRLDELPLPEEGARRMINVRPVRDLATMAIWVGAFAYEGIFDLRSLSLIDYVGDDTEISRRNCYEVGPVALVVFDPERPYPDGLLGELTMAAGLCEEAF